MIKKIILGCRLLSHESQKCCCHILLDVFVVTTWF